MISITCFAFISKQGKKEGFFIYDDSADDDAAYQKVTNAGISSLGMIRMASLDGEGKVTDPRDLVSTGAYTIQNSNYGHLQAGMKLEQTDTNDGYKIRIEVYNSLDTPELLAYKDFYVGKLSAKSEVAGVNTAALSPREYTITFDPNGGNWNGSTTPITSTVKEGEPTPDSPADPKKVGYKFSGWNPNPADTPIVTEESLVWCPKASPKASIGPSKKMRFLSPRTPWSSCPETRVKSWENPGTGKTR